MTTEQIRRLYDAKPFSPFVLHLADSREIPVPHRDFILISPSGRTVVVTHDDNTFEVIDLLLVTSVATTNGKTRQNRKR
jgi:hypothetical protein